MNQASPSALIDFTNPLGGQSLRHAFSEPLKILIAETATQVIPLLQQVQAFSRAGHWCVGYVRYEAAGAFDTALVAHAADGPLAWFAIYDRARPWPDTPAAKSPLTYWQEDLPRAVFDAKFSDIQTALARGELYQLNYTSQRKGMLQVEDRHMHLASLQNLFLALHRAQPDTYAAFIDAGHEQILSVSPELFFHWEPESGRILTRPMKGTARRGHSAEEDNLLAQALQASVKERAENVMIVDLIRNDLSRIAQPFSVRVPHLFRLQALPSVWQMTSDIEARTRPGITLAEVFSALFPCGSITGAPKVRAMQMIRQIEPEPRGVYCGAIGVVRPGGTATFNVAIRTVQASADTPHRISLRCGIGSGITTDASAQGEWQEWANKRAFLHRAMPDFELLETLALNEGRLRDAPAHLARMANAAAYFGYPLDRHKVQVALEHIAANHPAGAWRIRLRVNARGQAQAEAFVMDARTANDTSANARTANDTGANATSAQASTAKPVALKLASRAFDAASSEFVRFKTTQRVHYDAFTPRDEAVFDTLLWNAQGEITECTRGNIAIELDGRWVTPPLRCGLLNGIGRDRFLAEGRLAERVVRVQDLPRASGFAFINSLRGWVHAVLV